MYIDVTLKNVLAVLEKMLIPGSESLKMQAVKNDINAVIKAAQELQAQENTAKEGKTDEA
jgi:hypothetical protein